MTIIGISFLATDASFASSVILEKVHIDVSRCVQHFKLFKKNPRNNQTSNGGIFQRYMRDI